MEPETWRHEYEQMRYLREVHDVVLKRRFDDLAANLWSTDAAGNVTPPRSSESRQGILRLLLHTVLEQMERGGEDARDFSEQALRDASAAGYVPPRLKSPFTGSPACYAKFGKRDHIRAAYERGALRIMPASSYDDPSLNSAQADKELEHATVTPNEHLMFKLYGLNAEGTPERRQQAHRLAELVTHVAAPDDAVIVCGDFNVEPTSETFEILGKLGLADLVTTRGFEGTRTSHYLKPGRFADYMLVNECVEVLEFSVVVEPEVSDHCPLVLTI